MQICSEKCSSLLIVTPSNLSSSVELIDCRLMYICMPKYMQMRPPHTDSHRFVYAVLHFKKCRSSKSHSTPDSGIWNCPRDLSYCYIIVV